MTKFELNLRSFRTSAVVSLVVASFMCIDSRIVFAQGKTPQEIQTSCKKFVQNFYDWYVVSLNKSPDGPSSSSALTKKKSSFDPVLYKKLKDDFDAQAKVSGEIVGLDFDPFLNAQDFSDKYVVGKVKPKQSGAYWVEVHSVANGRRNPKPDVTPELAFRNGKWLFVNFHYGKSDYPENENLLSVLKALKQERDKGFK